VFYLVSPSKRVQFFVDYTDPKPSHPGPVFDDGMMVDKGEILLGIVDKKTVGATQGSLIHFSERRLAGIDPILFIYGEDGMDRAFIER
jgi:hypothetical protein